MNTTDTVIFPVFGAYCFEDAGQIVSDPFVMNGEIRVISEIVYERGIPTKIKSKWEFVGEMLGTWRDSQELKLAFESNVYHFFNRNSSQLVTSISLIRKGWCDAGVCILTRLHETEVSKEDADAAIAKFLDGVKEHRDKYEVIYPTK